MDCNTWLVVVKISILTVRSPDVAPVTKTKQKDKSEQETEQKQSRNIFPQFKQGFRYLLLHTLNFSNR